jgi:uncharacterized membrane protein
MSILLATFSIGGLLLSAISVPLILGRIKPNGLYGFRVRKTMENPEIWYPVNRFAGVCLFVCGLGIVAASIGLTLLPNMSIDGYSLGVTAVMVIALTISVILSVRYMDSL